MGKAVQKVGAGLGKLAGKTTDWGTLGLSGNFFQRTRASIDNRLRDRTGSAVFSKLPPSKEDKTNKILLDNLARVTNGARSLSIYSGDSLIGRGG